jgi:cobalt-precorrin-5B (C1)-methyltransferase
VRNGLRRGFFVGMAGKLAKLAAGVMMTHWTRSKVDNELLAGITREAGGSSEALAEVEDANTARHAYEIWRRDGLDRAPNILCELAARNLREHAKSEAGGEPLELHAIIVDFDTLEPTGASASALEQTRWGKA